MEELVTVRTYTYAYEAALAKSRLQSEDIYCFLKDELTIQANPFYSNALGGVKLQVPASEVRRAVDILDTMSERSIGDQPKTISVHTANGMIDECPACLSDEVSPVKKASMRIFGLSLLFLGFPLPVFSRMYHCYNCGRDIKVLRSRGNRKP
ncbi:MAG: DUF2007 domain-containing protein [Bacteroidetes bacterium]|nr:DUF2007 domain-containing protein [Bacteroidota bacterium]MBS1630462.1 DUF2007 domain-containing protein [Bacteroidota bacterium]